MPGLTATSVLVATGAMVAFDAAEYLVFSTVGKKLKSNLKGDNQTMMTVNDFIKQAQAKKAAAQAATNVVAKVKEVAVDTAAAVKETATTVKDAVVGAMPASHKEFDKLATNYAVLIAAMEQRLDYLEDQLGTGIATDPEVLSERVGQILASLAPVKKEKPKKDAPKVKAPAAPEAEATKPVKRAGTAGKPKMGGRFETPVDWSNVQDN